jgi:hypothetical protein
MSSSPTVHKFGGDEDRPTYEPRVVTDLAIPGRDSTDVQRFLDGRMSRSEAVNIVDDIETLSATHDPAVAIQGIMGMPVEAAIYMFSVGGKMVTGISAAGARALAAYRGGFTIVVAETEQTTKRVQIKTDDGEYEIHDVPSWLATVNVIDNTNGNTFPGVYNQAEVLALKDGGWRLNEHALQISVSKATRNAILYHFAGVAKVVQKFAEDAKKRGDMIILGHVSEEIDAASDARDQAAKHHQLRRAEPLGATEARVFKAEFDRTISEGEAVGKDMGFLGQERLAFIARVWGAEAKVPDIPLRDKSKLYEWLNDKRISLGLSGLPGYVDGEAAPEVTPAPAAEPEPAKPAPVVPKGRAAAAAQSEAEALAEEQRQAEEALGPQDQDLFADQ